MYVGVYMGKIWRVRQRNTALLILRIFDTLFLIERQTFSQNPVILRLYGKKIKNDMRHFNINMIQHPKPQITYDTTHNAAHKGVRFGSSMQQLN